MIQPFLDAITALQMSHIDYLLWKALGLVFLAFCWGVYCGITGRPLGPEPRDNQAGQDQDSTKDAASR
jgi:hypothetical protein